MTTLREKLVKIGAKVVSHGRYVTFQQRFPSPNQVDMETGPFWRAGLLPDCRSRRGKRILLPSSPTWESQLGNPGFNNIDQSFLTPYFEGLYKAGLRDPDQAAAD